MSSKKKDIKELTTDEKLDLIIELLRDQFKISGEELAKLLEDKPKDPPPTPPNT